MRASLLTIGDELLIGQVVDTNAAFIGAYLDEHDVQLLRHLTVGDAAGEIDGGLREARRGVDVVFVTGGLGPTDDDLTLGALARHLGRDLEFNEATYERIAYIFREIIKRPIAQSHRRQAMQPAGATTLPNAQGTAPGIWLEDDGQVFVAMPGVPREMKYLLREQAMPRLLERYPVEASRQHTLLTAGWGETQIADAIADVARALPPSTSLAYLPSLGTVRVRITVRGEAGPALDAELGRVVAAVSAALPAHLIVGDAAETTLPATVHRLLREADASVAVAESCTGGSIGRLLTEVPGASASFVGGVIAYDNALKTSLLGVAPATLDAEGAVSEATVREMVTGVLKCTPATWGVAASGIAGPGGGTPDKPVGTIWIAAGARGGRVQTRMLTLGRDRETNMAYTAVAALNLLRRGLLGV